MDEIGILERELARVAKKSAKLSAARMALPTGSSRARVTSLNAKWARAAEERDRIEKRLEELRAMASGQTVRP